MYHFEKLDLVNNKEGCQFYRLFLNGRCPFDEFVTTIEDRSNAQDKKKFYALMSSMNKYSPKKTLPATSFRHIKGVCRQDVYEFKKDALRVYVIMQEPNVFVVLGGFKTKQTKDINRLNNYLREIPQNIEIQTDKNQQL